MDFMSTLKQKYAGVPVWVWALLGTGVLTLVIMNRQKKAKTSTEAAAKQTSTDLGSASQLANLFQEAWPMSYMGGDVYINNVNGVPAPAPTTPMPSFPGKERGGNPPRQPGSGISVPGPSTAGIPTAPAVATRADTNPLEYRVKSGETWGAIAQRYGMSLSDLWNFNTGSGYGTAGRPASTIALIKQRGQGLIFPNSEIDIPHKGTIYAGTGGA